MLLFKLSYSSKASFVRAFQCLVRSLATPFRVSSSLCVRDQCLTTCALSRETMVHEVLLPQLKSAYLLVFFNKYSSSSFLFVLRDPTHLQVRTDLVLLGISLSRNSSYLFKTFAIPPSMTTHSSNRVRSRYATLRPDQRLSSASPLPKNKPSFHITVNVSLFGFAFKL